MQQSPERWSVPPAPAPRSCFAPGNGVTLHYLDWGGDGPPLLMQHPTGFTGGIWAPYAGAFIDRYHIIAPDSRGAGQSTLPADGDVRLTSMADDLIVLLDHLGLRDAVAIGHSAGGTQLALVASKRPDLITRLVLLDPVLPFPRDEAGTISGNSNMVEGARRRRPEFPSLQAMRDSYGSRPPMGSWHPSFLDAYLHYGVEVQPDGVARLRCKPEVEAAMFAGVPLPFPPSEVFSKLRCPILMISAEPRLGRVGDPSVVTSYAPQTRALIAEDHGHFFPYELPAWTLARIQEFLADHPASEAAR